MGTDFWRSFGFGLAVLDFQKLFFNFIHVIVIVFQLCGWLFAWALREAAGCFLSRICAGNVLWGYFAATVGLGFGGKRLCADGFQMTQLQPNQGSQPGFRLQSSKITGVDFVNYLSRETALTNAVVLNGAGLAIGDVDGDGWADLYFCSLQGSNRLYRNLGNWRFEEIKDETIACEGQFSTGAAFSDVDGDEDLDLLVNGISAGTRLFLNDGKGAFSERKDSGLSQTASATSMALADIDGDGDLDIYCAHYIDVMSTADPTIQYALVKRNGRFVVTHVDGEPTTTPRLRNRFLVSPTGRLRELPEADGLYLNEGGGRFRAVQFRPGVFMDAEGNPLAPYRDWGLAVMFRDINGDGFPDLYVCNDNASPDRVWLNSGKGTFRALPPLQLRHTSRSSMGVDFADVNRDGHDDFFVLDMLSQDPAKRMTQLVKQYSSGAVIRQWNGRPRYNRNTLFLGGADGFFVETALMAGVAASDWSWCPVFVDVDLDGYEDLLVSNGFLFDVLDQDSHDRLRTLKLSKFDRKRSRQFHPPLPLKNVAFRNRGDGTFEEVSARWGFDVEGISYGMASGDLDNDGDLDVVVNQLNQEALLFQNTAPSPRVKIILRGNSPNVHGIGARIRLTCGELTQSQEMINSGRYLACDEASRVFAFLGDSDESVRLEVIWRSGRRATVPAVLPNRAYTIYEAVSSKKEIQSLTKSRPLFADAVRMLDYVHREASGRELALQTILPSRLDATGPGISWFDADGDGWEELFISGGVSPAVFRNRRGREFQKMESLPPFPEGQGPVLGWNNGQGKRFWLAAASARLPRGNSKDGAGAIHVYNVKNGELVDVLETGAENISALCAADVDEDGDLDLFVGGGQQSGRYPEPAHSKIWLNNEGFLKYSEHWSRAFQSVGIVRGAVFFELDGDARPDLALALEWGSIRIFRNSGESFLEATRERGMHSLRGWWTGIAAADFDGDGRTDLAAGNRGRNTALAIYPTKQFRIWFADTNGNGILTAVESWKQDNRWLPIAARTTLSSVLPNLPRQFPTHFQFAQASMKDILDLASNNFQSLSANHVDSSIFLNKEGGFVPQSLPAEAQFAPVYAVNAADFDGDGREDLFLGQNDFSVATRLTRNDGGRGLWLRGRGDGFFDAQDSLASGLRIFGMQRGAALADYNQDGRMDLAATQKNAPVKLYRNQASRRCLRVKLIGPESNPEAIGARLRVVYSDGSMGPAHEVCAGSGYKSQNSAVQLIGMQRPAVQLWIRWPNGREQTAPLKREVWEVCILFEPAKKL